jgi:amidase
MADGDVVAAVEPTLRAARKLIGTEKTTRVFRADPAQAREAFRLLQAREAWASDGAWISKHRPKMGPDVQERFDIASKVTEEQVAGPRRMREEMDAAMTELLVDDAVLCLPTSPVPAPKRDASLETLGDVRARTMALTCVAGLARLPQISIPAGTVGGAPVGLSFVAARDNDMMLLGLARAIAG